MLGNTRAVAYCPVVDCNKAQTAGQGRPQQVLRVKITAPLHPPPELREHCSNEIPDGLDQDDEVWHQVISLNKQGKAATIVFSNPPNPAPGLLGCQPTLRPRSVRVSVWLGWLVTVGSCISSYAFLG